MTGYDAPILYCMYLDKPMKDHTLLQAIARVNRPYEDNEGLKKPSGFVLDFVGIFEKLEKALAFDSDVVGSVIQNIGVLKEEINQAKKEQAEKNFDAQKFTVYWILKKEEIENADELAVQIDGAFSQNRDWRVNAKEARELTAHLYKILLKTIDKDKAVGLVDKILKIGR